MEIFNYIQGTPEWHQARLGIITASEMKSVLTKGRGGEPSLTRQTYMHKLIGERMTGIAADSFSGWQTERGHELEPVARDIYASTIDEPVVQVGFIRDKDIGYSPDGLVGEDGSAEIKSRVPHLQVKLILEDAVPQEHIAQIQCGMFVSGRKWLDFISYCPDMPLFKKRVMRDDFFIDEMEAQATKFYKELQDAMDRIKELQNR